MIKQPFSFEVLFIYLQSYFIHVFIKSLENRKILRWEIKRKLGKIRLCLLFNVNCPMMRCDDDEWGCDFWKTRTKVSEKLQRGAKFS